MRKYGPVPKRPPLTAQRIIEAAPPWRIDGGLDGEHAQRRQRTQGRSDVAVPPRGGKESLLDGLADWIVEKIELPEVTDPWRAAMSARAHSAHDVLSAHPWAITLIESRPTPGLPLLRHHDRIVGCLLESGFTAALATHAFSAIDAYVYGFTLSEANCLSLLAMERKELSPRMSHRTG